MTKHRAFSINQSPRSGHARASLLAAAAVLLAGAQASASNCVVILQGHDTNSVVENSLKDISDKAAAQHAAKGYTVIRASNRAEFLAALNQPCVNRIVYSGHGVFAGNTPVAQWWIGPGTDPSDYLSASDVASAIPTARRGSIVSATFNSCGQLQQAWGNTFPNASIFGWTTEVSLWSVRWDQYYNQGSRIAQKAARQGTPIENELFGYPYDPRLAEVIRLVPNGTPGVMIARNWADYPSYGWTLPEPLASAIGTKTFGFMITTSPGDEVFMGSFSVTGGLLVTHTLTPGASPDFVVIMDHGAYESVIINRDTILPAFASGLVRIAGNTTGLPDRTLFAAAAKILFGVTAPAAPCIGDASGDGAVTFADITSVLSNFGGAGPAFRPGDANGDTVVNFADVTTVLSHFNLACL